MLRSQAKARRRAGAVAVETALVIGTLLLLLFAIFEYGRFVMIRHLVDNAARQGARVAVSAIVNDANSFNYQTTATVQAAVTNALAGQDVALTGLTTQVYLADAQGNNIGTWTNARFAQNVAVQVSATYTPLFANLGFLPTNVPVTATAMMQSEAN
jgi:Flp pilus assembly protein TadG